MRQNDLQDPAQRFLVELPRGTVLRPAPGRDGVHRTTVTMRPASVTMHPALPPTPLWTYEGAVPGPRIEVPAGRPTRVTWVNELTGVLPYRGVRANDADQLLAGDSGGEPDPQTKDLPPYTVVHLHGGRTDPDSDGWAENVLATGQRRTAGYREDGAALLWYHDHAVGATRLTVYSGLAGMFVVRDDLDHALPHGERELFLLLADRNLDADVDGQLTGGLLHKTGDLDGGPMEFFGPFTTVNGALWPRCGVHGAQYRVRLLNGSNARTWRLTLADEAGKPCTARITVIGTDGGLLPVDPTAEPQQRAAMGPVALTDSDALVLAPAERLDLIVDFRGATGPLRLVNDAAAPWDGSTLVALTHTGGRADAADAGEAAKLRAQVADVIQFVPEGPPVPDGFCLDRLVSSGRWPTYTRYAHDRPPFDQHMHRTVGVIEDGTTGILTLNELYRPDDLMGLAGRGYLLRAPFLTLAERDHDDQPLPAVTWATAASAFLDAVTFQVTADGYELWRLVNLTGDTHPVHLHLVQFQVLSRVGLDFTEPWEPSVNTDPTGAGNQLVTVGDRGSGHLERTELGWKDTVRVDPHEMVSVMARFTGHAGRFMYHCHVLEHEDMDMMRPFVVVPAALRMPDGLARVAGADAGLKIL